MQCYFDFYNKKIPLAEGFVQSLECTKSMLTCIPQHHYSRRKQIQLSLVANITTSIVASTGVCKNKIKTIFKII